MFTALTSFNVSYRGDSLAVGFLCSNLVTSSCKYSSVNFVFLREYCCFLTSTTGLNVWIYQHSMLAEKVKCYVFLTVTWEKEGKNTKERETKKGINCSPIDILWLFTSISPLVVHAYLHIACWASCIRQILFCSFTFNQLLNDKFHSTLPPTRVVNSTCLPSVDVSDDSCHLYK